MVDCPVPSDGAAEWLEPDAGRLARPVLSAVTAAAVGAPKKPGTDRRFGKLGRRAAEDRLPIGAINARFLAWSKVTSATLVSSCERTSRLRG
jgi:hypothetical protein